MSETIDGSGKALAFKVRAGEVADKPSGPDFDRIMQVDARLLHHHQKEAIVADGVKGPQWRMTSDEGAHLKGTDLAPFPLGFFNVGLQADLLQCIGEAAAERGVSIDAIRIDLDNQYWFTGSFVLGTGSGHAAPSRAHLAISSDASPATVDEVIRTALMRSPAFALLRDPLSSTFALIVNGRPCELGQMRASQRQGGAKDPFLVYREPPKPLDPRGPSDLIVRTNRSETGSPQAVASATDGRFMINVAGQGRRDGGSTQAHIASWLRMAGATHFEYRADVGGGEEAPSGLALVSAAIAFCFMTQLSRYIEHQKLATGDIRLAQFSRYQVAGGTALSHGVDTHLFMNGRAPEDVQSNLVRIAAHTCYLHATLAAALPLEVTASVNGAGSRVIQAPFGNAESGARPES